MIRIVRNCLLSGLAGGVLSQVVASVRGRTDCGSALKPVHAISHIAWNDEPSSHRGRRPSNFVVGTALHLGASIFWAAFFESLFGRRAERSTTAALIGGATVAGAAYVTDYHVVSRRYEPGFDAYLSGRSMFLVYAGLAIGLAASARSRGLHHHQVEDRDERDESGHSERRPHAVVAPVEGR